MATEWIPETYPRSGGLAAAGFYKLLGRPRMDPLTVLVRETAQNSWDARDLNSATVGFRIEARILADHEAGCLKAKVFVDLHKVKGTKVSSTLTESTVTALVISDRNTKGLGGPVRGDLSNPDGVYDWVDFILNVGKANTQKESGGTYGFGKTISYIVSNANAIVVYSRAKYEGKIVSRFIACAIGDEFEMDGRLMTGRHWWGRRVEGAPEPIVGQEADDLADELGLPPFSSGELGTNILILSPDFSERTMSEAMTFIAESVLWNLWPKLLAGSQGAKPMDISLFHDGERVTIPDPSDRPPLQGFVQAYRYLLEGDTATNSPIGAQSRIIRCKRPDTEVGDLVTIPLVKRARAAVFDGYDPLNTEGPAPAALIREDSAHHVALLRSPELVVEYFAGPLSPESGTEWCGVFRSRDAHDGKFAAAEPPTHDSWNPELIPTRMDRTVVNVALREIRAELKNRWGPRIVSETSAGGSTAAVANELSHLVAGLGSSKAEPSGPSGSASRSKAQPVPTCRLVSAGPVFYEGSVATRAHFSVIHSMHTAKTVVKVLVGVATDGDRIEEDLDPCLEIALIRVDGTGTTVGHKQVAVQLDGGKGGEFELIVVRSPETTVLFDVQLEVPHI